MAIISFDFDGVLHTSVVPDKNFYNRLDRAVYHAIDKNGRINQMTTDLTPNKPIIKILIPTYPT